MVSNYFCQHKKNNYNASRAFYLFCQSRGVVNNWTIPFLTEDREGGG